MIANQALYGPADACSSASRKVFELSDAYSAGSNVSFSEADTAFTMMCTLPGCKERLINYIRSCSDIVS